MKVTTHPSQTEVPCIRQSSQLMVKLMPTCCQGGVTSKPRPKRGLVVRPPPSQGRHGGDGDTAGAVPAPAPCKLSRRGARFALAQDRRVHRLRLPWPYPAPYGPRHAPLDDERHDRYEAGTDHHQQIGQREAAPTGQV